MDIDVASFTQRCQACQLNSNRIHTSTVEYHSLSIILLFHTWTFDLISPVNPLSRGQIWILAASECSTKWGLDKDSEMSKATTANFIQDNIICQFGIPKRLLSDCGTPFVNVYVRELLDSYEIDHVKPNPYYSQENG